MIQRSSAQKSIDRENAPIQDQYFIFVLIIGYTLNGYYFVLRQLKLLLLRCIKSPLIH